MGALKKKIRADVRRAARLVIDRYYLETKGRSMPKEALETLVQRTEKEVVPAIISALKEETD